MVFELDYVPRTLLVLVGRSGLGTSYAALNWRKRESMRCFQVTFCSKCKSCKPVLIPALQNPYFYAEKAAVLGRLL